MGAAVKASCHCGAVRFEVAEAPTEITSCNCSICRRNGALWAYYHPNQVRFETAPEVTVAYIQGDRCLALHHCPTCGCTTHWRSITLDYTHRMGVNARLFEMDIGEIPVRHNDGASY